MNSNLLRDKNMNQVNNKNQSIMGQKMKRQQEKKQNIKIGQKKNKNGKSEDFVFKRYRYERNHLITGGNQDGNVNNRTRHGVVDDDEYDGVHNKQNELEKYKKELQQQGDKFGLVDFGNDQDQNDQGEVDQVQEQQKQQQKEEIQYVNNQSTKAHQNIFQQQQQKQQQQKQISQYGRRQQQQQFDIKPMELVDFDQQQQQQEEEQVGYVEKVHYQKDNENDNKNDEILFDEKQWKLQQIQHQCGEDNDNNYGNDNNKTAPKHKNNHHNNITFISNQSLNLSHDYYDNNNNNSIRHSHQHLMSPSTNRNQKKKKTAPKSVFFSQALKDHNDDDGQLQSHDGKRKLNNQDRLHYQHTTTVKKNNTTNNNNNNNNNTNNNNKHNTNNNKYQLHRLTQKDNPFNNIANYTTNQQYQLQSQQQLKGVKITKLPNNENIQVQIIDKQLFVTSKIPPGIIIKCKLKRSSGFMSLMNPQYDLYLQNGMKHLVSAKKNVFRNRELFYLSTKISDYDKPIRTLMANVLHSTYWLVDQPRLIERKKISYLDILIDYKQIKQKYSREMTVLCPPTLKTYHIGLEYDIPCIDFYWFQKNITLQLHYRHKLLSGKKSSQKNFELIDSQDEDQEERQYYHQQVIKHNKEKKSLSLFNSNNNTNNNNNNFNNNNRNTTLINNLTTRMQQTSQGLKRGKRIEQLQLQHQDNNKYFYLKMQKSSQNIFDIEIQHPLTPLQAMAIILTRFDAQLK